jgi:hypothetical protein
MTVPPEKSKAAIAINVTIKTNLLFFMSFKTSSYPDMEAVCFNTP